MLRWIAAALCAYFVKGLCGFANTLVFTTMLSFGHDNVNISPVDLLLGYPANVMMAWKERRAIRWRMCLPLIALILLGNIPGMLFLKNADTGLVKIIFGAVTVALGVEMLLPRPGSGRQSKGMLTVIGLLSGMLCGMYGVGALMSAYVSRATEDVHAFKANMCVVFVAENTFRIVAYALLNILTPKVIEQAATLVPVMLAGLFLGMRSSRYLKESHAKRMVILMLIVSGAALIINSL